MSKRFFFFLIMILFVILLSNKSNAQTGDEVFTINKTATTIEQGSVRTFTITTDEELDFNINTSDSNIIDIVYNNTTISSNDTITINGTQEFTISGLNSGSTTIHITTIKDNQTYEKSIKATVIEKQINSFDLDTQDITIKKGETATFTITCDGETDFGIDTEDKNIISMYNDDTKFDNSIITVNNKKTITIMGLSEGKAKINIFLSYKEMSANDDNSWIERVIGKEINVTVVRAVMEKQVNSFDLDKQDITIKKGETATFTITCDGETDFGIDTEDKNIISMYNDNTKFDNSIITVNNKKTITIMGLSEGKAKINVSLSYKEMSANDDDSWIERVISKEINVTVINNENNNITNNSSNNNGNTINNIKDTTTSTNPSLPYTGVKAKVLIIVLIVLAFALFVFLYKYWFYKNI